jgi:toluene monooxygenase system protein E
VVAVLRTSSRAAVMKTYSRLQTDRRRPSEYEIVSSDLHYSYPSKFELPDSSPIVRWYLEHREGSRLRVRTWEAFSDPRQTTYRAYTSRQDRQEQVLDALFDEIDETAYDQRLDETWVSFLHQQYLPLRFPLHGLEMLAAYVGQMAPSSRLTNCAAFQAGDELRALQRIAYRTAQLGSHRPGHDFGEHRASWEDAPAFQPLRELIERAFVCYDWAEAFVVLNVVIKPVIDRWMNSELAARLGSANSDPLLRSVHFSLAQDSEWHRAWTGAALRVAVLDEPRNVDIIARWIAEWRPLADAAIDAFAAVAGQAPRPLDPAAVRSRIVETVRADAEAMLGSHRTA